MTTRNNEVDITAVIRARDESRAAMSSATRNVDGLNRGFTQFNKTLGFLGIAGISSAVALRSIVQGQERVARATASSTLITNAWGRKSEQNLRDLSPLLSGVAKDFGFTSADAQEAFNVIVREGNGANVTLADLRGAMGLARSMGLDLASASRLIGQRKRGETEAWEASIGPVRGYAEDLELAAEAGEDATTGWQRFSGQLQEGAEKVGGALGDVLDFTNDFGPSFSEIGGAAEDAFSDALDAVNSWLDGNDNARKTMEELEGQVVTTVEPLGNLTDGFSSYLDSLDKSNAKSGVFNETLGNLTDGFSSYLDSLDKSNAKSGVFNETLGFLIQKSRAFNETLGIVSDTIASMPSLPSGVHGQPLQGGLNITGAPTGGGADSAGSLDIPSGGGGGLPPHVTSQIQAALAAGVNVDPDLLAQMGTGGIIPGPVGMPRLIVGHGGERVLPTSQSRGGSGGVTINIHGDVRDESTVRSLAREVNKLLFEESRRGL